MSDDVVPEPTLLGATPEKTAERMATSWLQVRLTAVSFLAVLDDGDLDNEYEALVDQMLAENTSGRLIPDDDYDGDAIVRVFDRLPDDETRGVLHRYREHDEERENIRTDAAFLFGLALGRQLGGAL